VDAVELAIDLHADAPGRSGVAQGEEALHLPVVEERALLRIELAR